MDWNTITSFVKKQGFAGDTNDAIAIKSFLAENEIILADEDGQELNIGQIYTKSLKKENEDIKEQARKAIGNATFNASIPKSHTKETSMNSDFGKKMYDAKIKANKARFIDADQAETFAATTRLAFMGNKNYAQKAGDLDIAKKAQVEYDNTLGGFLVPEEFVSQLVYMTEPYGVARKLANVVRMARDLTRQPRKTSIASMSWVGEGSSTSVVNNGYDAVELAARKLQILMQASNELLEDSAINVADDLAQSIREAYDIAIDNSYFLGDGTSTYGGYTGLANALPASAYIDASGSAWSAITSADFTKALGSLQNVNSSRIVMVCSRQFYFQVLLRLEKATSQFKDLTGGATGGADASFLGYPVFFSQVLPTASASGAKSVYIGDFVGGSMIGERRDLTVTSSEHAAFSSDSWQWRATARAAVNIHGDGRGSTYGPIVCLKTT
jgi:HK97 family phage major capsid protein